jgi:hypothetical protein
MVRPLLASFAVLFAVVPATERAAQAQPYCANYSSGPPSCGIPTLASCEQSISGVGGYCAPDQTSQLRPNLMDRWRSERAGQDLPPPGLGPSGNSPDFMPPPPEESPRR